MKFSVDRRRRKWASGPAFRDEKTLASRAALLLTACACILAWSDVSWGAVPLPRPRPAQAPRMQRSAIPPAVSKPAEDETKPAQPDAADTASEDKPADSGSPDSKNSNSKTTDLKSPSVKPPSACRLALSDAIAIAPSVPAINGPGACGGDDLVRLEGVVLPEGKHVAVKPAAILRCTMASAIADWVRTDVTAFASGLGTAVSEIDNFNSYECRGRNRVVGAKLSEHGRANALDVRGIKLANGNFISLTDRTQPRELREQVLHSVCERFSTVLGPGSDWYHEDHIHLDLAERRGDYRICQWNVYDPLPVVAPLMPAVRPDDAPPREDAANKTKDGASTEAAPQTQASPRAAGERSSAEPPSAEPRAEEPEGAEAAPQPPMLPKTAPKKASNTSAKTPRKIKGAPPRPPLRLRPF